MSMSKDATLANSSTRAAGYIKGKIEKACLIVMGEQTEQAGAILERRARVMAMSKSCLSIHASTTCTVQGQKAD